MMWWWWSVALAAPQDLVAAQCSLWSKQPELALERVGDAASGEARRTFEALGMADWLPASGVDDPAVALGATFAAEVEAGREAEALAAHQALTRDHPERLDLLAPLWSLKATRKLTGLRKKVLYAARTAEGDDVLWAYALHRQLGEVPLATMTQAKAVCGAVALPARSLRSDVELQKEAVRVVEGGASLDLAPGEALDVALRAHTVWMNTGRASAAAAMWAASEATEPVALSAWAQAAEHARGDGEALAWRAFVALGRPSRSDMALRSVQRAKVDAAAALSALAWTAEPGLAWAAEVSYATIAGARTGAKVSPATASTMEGRFPSRDPISTAIAAIGGASPEDVTSAWRDAWVVVAATVTAPEAAAERADLYLPRFGEVWAAGARRTLEVGEVEEGLALAALARLAGGVDPSLALAAAEAHERRGEVHAAFGWFADARAGGLDVGDALVRTYRGPADPIEVADRVAVKPPVSAVEAPSRTTTAVRASSSPRRSPSVGDLVDWQVTTPTGGRLGASSLRGKLVILSFFKSDCRPCLDQLPAIGSLARGLRADARDVVHVAISLDEREASFQQTYTLGQRWGELAWSPGAAAQLGVERLPTTWLIDRKGVLRYKSDVSVEAEELRRAMGPMLVD